MNKKRIDKNKNMLDPFQAAQMEGFIYGVGLKGSYKQTIITRIGFSLMGALVFGIGICFLLLFFRESRHSGPNLVVLVLFWIAFLMLCLVGIVVFRSAFRKKK